MSAVNVLGVLDELVADIGDTSGTTGHQVEQARAAVAGLMEALHEGRRAIGDHHAPNDCYATGPVTGDSFRDLMECPACAFIAKYDAAIAKATGGTP